MLKFDKQKELEVLRKFFFTPVTAIILFAIFVALYAFVMRETAIQLGPIWTLILNILLIFWVRIRW